MLGSSTPRGRTTALSLGAVLLAALAGGPIAGTPVADAAPPSVERREIDLAICLDTSGSMSGLIDAARQKLWAIVNDLALADPMPELRVAVVTFGNDGHLPENGWVAVDVPFTDDLDRVSERLFALTTNGGTEYVGRVLRIAGQLDWTPSPDALRLAIVAGNESAHQDAEMPYEDVCRDLIGRGILVNAIYCGRPTDTEAPGWRDVALLADGHFATIDQNDGTVVVESPFDEELTQLSAALNETYVPFGDAGAAGLENQRAQDANATGLNSAAAACRAKTKASALYACSWDLVDACSSGQVTLADLEADVLPEFMREMTPEERAAYVADRKRAREDIQAEIAELGAKRDAFVADELARAALDRSRSFDHAVLAAVRSQAESRGFEFETETAAAR